MNPSHFLPLGFQYVGFMFTLQESKIPSLRFVIIRIRLSGLELFTFLMAALIEVKSRRIRCRTIWIESGKKKPEAGSELGRLGARQAARLTLGKGRSDWGSCDSSVMNTVSDVSKLNRMCFVLYVTKTLDQVVSLSRVCQMSDLRWHFRWYAAHCVPFISPIAPIRHLRRANPLPPHYQHQILRTTVCDTAWNLT